MVLTRCAGRSLRASRVAWRQEVEMERCRSRRQLSRRVARAAAALCALALFSGCSDMPRDARADGIVWQTETGAANPVGNWQLLGVHDLLIQWTVVDDTAFVANAGVPMASRLPDFERISREPWARDVVLGLAGYADERRARQNVDKLVDQSAAIARLPTPLHVTGYYFPVEIDPTWIDAPKLGAALANLPRPLWVTVYDRSNIGGAALAQWLDGWLPPDVGVFFQDGCGVYARVPSIAKDYLDALSARLGKNRVRVIAEAFRPSEKGGFRSATADELRAQLVAYRGYRIYLFDGPHYVPPALVKALAPAAAARQDASR
jgi:hypothetical protein